MHTTSARSSRNPPRRIVPRWCRARSLTARRSRTASAPCGSSTSSTRRAPPTTSRALELRQELNLAALRRTFEALVERHPALRTIFVQQGDDLRQMIQPQPQLAFQTEMLSDQREERLTARLRTESERPFDLTCGPLLRIHVFSRSAEQHVLLLVIHHIIADFWSLTVLLQEVQALYPAFVRAAETGQTVAHSQRLRPLTLQYTDYVEWQMALLQSRDGEQLWRYWQQQLSDDLPILQLPIDSPRPPIQGYRGASQTLELPPDLVHDFRALVQA